MRLFASELELAVPELPWHANRVRVAELGAALAVVVVPLAKIAGDVALLAQTEVGEVSDPRAGGSSTLPHKRNPVGSAVAVACARQVGGYAAVLTAVGAAEHERGLGGWQAEWHALSVRSHLRAAPLAVRKTLERLEVHPERMAANLRLTGALSAERASFLLAERLGRQAAHELVAAAAARARDGGRELADDLASEPGVELSRDELAAALEPTTYLGSAEAFVDRALQLYREEAADP